MMKDFQLSQEQYDKYVAWREAKPSEIYVGAIGGGYSFVFIPTGLGIMVRVTCADGTELDLTDWDNW